MNSQVRTGFILLSVILTSACHKTTAINTTEASTPLSSSATTKQPVPVILDAALEIDAHPCQVSLVGEITPHAADALDSFIALHTDCESIFVKAESPGGDVYAALRIGRAIREKFGRVIVGEDIQKPCVSACVLVVAGGVERTNVNHEDLHILGVHSVYPVQADTGMVDALASYTNAYQEVKKYLDEMRISPRLLEYMYSAAPWTIRWLTNAEAKDLLLLGDDPVFEEFYHSQKAKQLGISFQTYVERKAESSDRCHAKPEYSSIEEFQTEQRCEENFISHGS